VRIIALKTKILRLLQGLPQDWIYIERKVLADLQSSSNEGVKAPINFVGKNLAEIFKKDIADVNARQVALIRPIIGANGAGKTTQMEIQIKRYVSDIFEDKGVFLFFDFKYISDSEEEFWPIFIQRFYEQIQEHRYLKQLCDKLSRTKLKQDLIRKFKNTKLVENIINSISEDVSAQARAEEFFYGSEISRKDISDFFNGFLNLALDLDRLVVLCLDEVQFLIDIDPTQTLVKIILEQFIRKLYEQYSNKKLYIVISCLQNPDKREYDKLKGISKNFQSIVEGKEIILGNLTVSEKNAILNQVCDKIRMETAKRKRFLSQVKRRIEYFLPRELLKSIAEILDIMGFTCYSREELRNLYEREARTYVKPILIEKGFVYVEDKPKKVGGYNIDIYASAETNRYQRTPNAFGEVTIIQRKTIKEKVEKFAAWLHQMKGKEYRPNRGDYAFFVCPKNRLTQSSQEVLRSNNIDIIEFDSSLINEINQLEQEPDLSEDKELSLAPPEEIPTPSADSGLERSSLKQKLIIGKKPVTHKLEDIPGIGQAKVKLLQQANILTINDLITCNPRIIAGKVKGLGLKSLTKWIQRAKQIVNE